MSELFAELKEQMAEKVKKLLRLAEDPAATPEEAQAFTAKAQQMMSKYAIDLAMISDAHDIDQLVAERIVIADPYARRKVSLANSVARANDCRGIYSTFYTTAGKKAYYIEIVGYATDVDWVKTLYASLEVQLASALTRDAKRRSPNENGRTWSVNYIDGFSAAISNRLTAAKREAKAQAEREQWEANINPAPGTEPPFGPSVALVLADKAKQVESEFKVRHPRTRTVSSRSTYSSSGHNSGAAAGQTASLARGSVGGHKPGLGR